MRGVLAACVGVAMGCFGVAWAEPPQTEKASPYRVIAENASIAFAGTRVRGFRVGEDGSLLLDAGRRWYRAELWEPCRRDLRFEHKIALIDRPGDRFDRFSRVLVDGSVCPVERVDEIADPDAADEAPPAA